MSNGDTPTPAQGMNVKQITTTVAATVTALGLGSGGALNTFEYSLINDSQLRAYEERIAGLEADKTLILAQKNAEAEEHLAAYNSLGCSWAFMLHCTGGLVSPDVFGGACRESLEQAECPARFDGLHE